MVSYLGLWSRYKKCLLEPLVANKEGIRESELRKQSGMSATNFYVILKELEKRQLITRLHPEHKLTFVLPTKKLLMFFEYYKHPRFELAMIDLEAVAYGEADESEVIAEIRKEWEKWKRRE